MKYTLTLVLGVFLLVSCTKEEERLPHPGAVTLNLQVLQSEWTDLGLASKTGAVLKEDMLTDLRGQTSVVDPSCTLLRDISIPLGAATENKMSVEFVGLVTNSDNPVEQYPKFKVKNFTEQTLGIYYGLNAVIEMELTNGVWRALQTEYVEAKQEAYITSFFPTTWFQDIFAEQLTGRWRVSTTTNTAGMQIELVNPEVSVLSNVLQSCDSGQLLCQTGAVVVNDLGNMQNGLDEEYTLFINGVQKDQETGELYLRYGLITGTAVTEIRMGEVTRDAITGPALVPETAGVSMVPGDVIFFSIPLESYATENPLIYINFDLVFADNSVVSKNLSTSLKSFYDNIIAGTTENTLPFLEVNVCSTKPEYDCTYPEMPQITLPEAFQVRFKNNPLRPDEEFVFWPVAAGQTTFDIPLGIWDIEVSSWNDRDGEIPSFGSMPVFYDLIQQQDLGKDAVADITVQSISSAVFLANRNLGDGFTPGIRLGGSLEEHALSLNNAGSYWVVFPYLGPETLLNSYELITEDVEGKRVVTTSQQQASKVYRFMVCPGGGQSAKTISNSFEIK